MKGFAIVRALLGCALILVFCAGCNGSLPAADTSPTTVDCTFPQQTSQAACQTLTTNAQCASSRYDSDRSCRGTSCAKVAGGTPNASLRYCGETSTFFGLGLSDSVDQLLAGSGASDLVAVSASARPAASGKRRAVVSTVADRRLKSTQAITITEYALPTADMEPIQIVVSGQTILFGASATCNDTCSNSGVFSIDATGKVALADTFCANGGDACRVTGLTPLTSGDFCYAASRIVTNFTLLPDAITCKVGNSKSVHNLHLLDGFTAGLAVGFDGHLWYTDAQLNGIGRLSLADTTTVQATYLQAATNVGIGAIVAGPDSAMWFTAAFGNQVGRIDGTALKLTTLPSADSRPAGIALGPDNNLWFTEFKGNKIGRITTAGVVTEFALPTASAGPVGIAAGPDGTMWFTEAKANMVGRITMSGTIEEYAIPTANSQPSGIAWGPDNNMWFTEYQSNKIGKFTPPPVQALPQVVEFYNVILDNYFITANPDEQNAIDKGSAGPGWSRTGTTFSSGGSAQVCRFYGSITPGPNSHFYTADPAECAQLKQLQATTPASQPRWNFESNDFLTTPATAGACPANLLPVFRAYNNGFTRGIDSNHRITPSQASIADVVKRGWSSEGIVMCAPQQ